MSALRAVDEDSALRRLGEALGYRFRDAGLLRRALTHRSLGADNYERLEFLGDGCLNCAVGAEVYARRPQASEGDLTRLRASLVREATLATAARRLHLDRLLRLAPAEQRSGGHARDSILADALEAVIGAVFLEGGFEAAAAVCRQVLAPELAALPAAEALKDPKTRLQEWLQARGRPLPEYRVQREEGPPHRRWFAVALRLPDTGEAIEAEGASRRNAEQRAAEDLLQRLDADRDGGPR